MALAAENAAVKPGAGTVISRRCTISDGDPCSHHLNEYRFSLSSNSVLLAAKGFPAIGDTHGDGCGIQIQTTVSSG